MNAYHDSATSLYEAMMDAAEFSRQQHENGKAGKGVAIIDKLVVSAANFGKQADKLANAPDWESIAMRLFARFPIKPVETDFIRRVQAHLDQPHMKARAALPLEQRRAIASITSYHLS